MLTNFGKDMSGIIAITEALKTNESLKEIDLSGNLIKEQGAKYVSEALKINKMITSINLGGNQLRVEGAKHISEALKVNQTITSINLQGNESAKQRLREAAPRVEFRF